MDSQALVRPLELGIRTPNLWHGPLSWGYRLACLGVGLLGRDTDSHVVACALELGKHTPALLHGPLSCGQGLLRFGVAP